MLTVVSALDAWFTPPPSWRGTRPALNRPTFNAAARSPAFKFWSDGKPFIYSVVALNALIFLHWQYALNDPAPVFQVIRHRVRRQTFMKKHFTISKQKFAEGRYHTLLTGAFTHMNLWHLAGNMYAFHTLTRLLFMGGAGLGTVAALAAGSAVAGSLGLLADMAYFRAGNSGNGNGLGASGIVQGIPAAVACALPWLPVTTPLIPVPMPL
ncbi:hypothetical protein B0H66DRAFT_484914 [Apodospora peruviana]|uniref:Peptidase S54 rhomboid domain-containing protein n=1 Tax=Apodospora peruviana TaxID=516989 RepID=A0AAE0HTX8_9PEZI|nr:hypothetical protein B0H66DRAFT_484914 [Apodospora peruviana]